MIKGLEEKLKVKPDSKFHPMNITFAGGIGSVFSLPLMLTDNPYTFWSGFGLYVAAASCDFLDGKVARASELCSEAGALFDAGVDKAKFFYAFPFVMSSQADNVSNNPEFASILTLGALGVLYGFNMGIDVKNNNSRGPLKEQVRKIMPAFLDKNKLVYTKETNSNNAQKEGKIKATIQALVPGTYFFLNRFSSDLSEFFEYTFDLAQNVSEYVQTGNGAINSVALGVASWYGLKSYKKKMDMKKLERTL